MVSPAPDESQLWLLQAAVGHLQQVVAELGREGDRRSPIPQSHGHGVDRLDRYPSLVDLLLQGEPHTV